MPMHPFQNLIARVGVSIVKVPEVRDEKHRTCYEVLEAAHLAGTRHTVMYGPRNTLETTFHTFRTFWALVLWNMSLRKMRSGAARSQGTCNRPVVGG